MVDLKNRNCKVYDLGKKLCLILGFIVAITYFVNRNTGNSEFVFMLNNTQQVIFIIFSALIGTETVFAKKDKSGYWYYFTMFIILIILIDRNLSIIEKFLF